MGCGTDDSNAEHRLQTDVMIKEITVQTVEQNENPEWTQRSKKKRDEDHQPIRHVGPSRQVQQMHEAEAAAAAQKKRLEQEKKSRKKRKASSQEIVITATKER